MDGSILTQGTFTQPATAVNQTIVIPSNADWLRVLNYTQANQGTSAAANGFDFWWQRGMPSGTGIVKIAGVAGAVTVNVTANNAFTLYDPSGNPYGTPVATTSGTNATRPVIATGSTTGLVAGTSIVRLSGITAQSNICGPEFVIDTVVANTSFRIQNTLATAPGAGGGAGFYRIVNYNPLFYPRRRFIASITQAAAANVLTTIPHGYVNGQLVRFVIPSVSAMTQLDGLTGTVTVVDANNFTVNVDTTAFSAFTFPTAAQMPASYPLVVPVGEDTAGALAMSPVPDILSDATVNTGFLGMTLTAGALLPAGVASDVVYWRAGKSVLGGL